MTEKTSPKDWRAILSEMKTPQEFWDFFEMVSWLPLNPEMKLERISELYKRINIVEAELTATFLNDADLTVRAAAGEVLMSLLEIKIKITGMTATILKLAQY